MVDKDTTIRILGYAKNGFLQNGYQGTSLANICGQAGVTTGALYHRFPSKDALFRAVVEPASNELLEKLICPQENVNAIIPEPCLTFTYTYWDVFRTIVRCKDAPSMLNFTKCYPIHCINDYYSVEGNYLDKRICHSSCPKHIWLGF